MRTGLTVIHEHNRITFAGEIVFTDLANARLSKGDKALMNECGWNAPAQDTLLVLEMLFRRINEANAAKEPK